MRKTWLFLFLLIFWALAAPGARAAQNLNDLSSICLDRSALWVGTPEGLIQYEYPALKPLRLYRVEDGLPSNRITALLTDSNADLWVGTPSGLGHYKKSTLAWETFNSKGALPADSISALALDLRGRLWVGTTGGLATLQGDTWKIYRKADGLPSEAVLAVYADGGGTLWVGTSAGLCSFDGIRFSPVKWDKKITPLKIRCIWEDKEGRLWVGTSGGLVERRKKNRWVLSDKEFRGGDVRVLLQDKEDKLMAGTDRGVFIQNEKKWEAVSNAALPSSDVRAILKDTAGNFLLATASGLSRWVEDSRSSYLILNDLPSGFVNAVTCGWGEDVWVGTEGGLVVSRGGKWEKIPDWTTLNTLPDNEKKALLKEKDPEGEGWLTGDDLSEEGPLSPKGSWSDEWQSYLAGRGIVDGQVFSSFLDADGSVWFGTGRGVSIFNGKKWRTLLPGRDLAGREVSFIYRDINSPEKVYWIGTDSALTALSGAKKQPVTYTVAQGLSSNILRAAAEFSGSLYVATEGGVDRLNGGGFESLPLPDGYLESHPRALLSAGNSLWIGTDQGLLKYEGSNYLPIIEKEGRLAEEITALSSEGRNIWVGTMRGASRFDGKEWKHYGFLEGLAGSYVRGFAADGRGLVWVATYDGLARFDGKSWTNYFSSRELVK